MSALQKQSGDGKRFLMRVQLMITMKRLRQQRRQTFLGFPL